MKKRAFMILVVMLGMFGVIGCSSIETINNTQITEQEDLEKVKQGNDVKLLSFKEYVQPITYYKMGNTASGSGDASPIQYEYISLYENKTEFTIEIKLDNPKDYHILDFKLSCDDADIEILINEKYVKLNTTDNINWQSDDNKVMRLYFNSESKDFLRTLKLENLFYIDREDSSITYTANLQNKNIVDIYMFVRGVDFEFVGLSNQGAKYKAVRGSEYMVESSLQYGDYVNNNWIFEDLALGDYVVNKKDFGCLYDYQYNGRTIKGGYTFFNNKAFANVVQFEKNNALLTQVIFNKDALIYENTCEIKIYLNINHLVTTLTNEFTYVCGNNGFGCCEIYLDGIFACHINQYEFSFEKIFK